MIEIKFWQTGNVLHSIEADSLKNAVEMLVRQGADLRGADLRGAYLRGADLRGAYLRGAYLRDADLRGAYLRGAYLRGAYLRDADLRGAYLRGAYLRDADLEGADLRGAYLRGAYLRDADLRGAYLRGAYLRDASYDQDVPLTKEPVQILGLKWFVLILDSHLKIGCELHSFDAWRGRGNEIAEKHNEATWWIHHRDMIFAVIKAARGA
jgi:uncharacterized protein YjbI with pentapeptide repeats